MYAGVVVGMSPMDNMALAEGGRVDKVNIDDTWDDEGRLLFSRCPSFSMYDPLLSFYFSSNFQSATSFFPVFSAQENSRAKDDEADHEVHNRNICPYANHHKYLPFFDKWDDNNKFDLLLASFVVFLEKT